MDRLGAAAEHVKSLLPGSAKVLTQTTNTAQSGMASSLDPRAAPVLLEGTVVRSGCGWYDFAVHIPGHPKLVGCTMLSAISSNIMGVSECSIPLEGTRVMVQLNSTQASYGTIIGVFPDRDTLPSTDNSRKISNNVFSTFYELESGASVGSEDAYSVPLASKGDLAKVNANATRPLDILPGNYALINEQQVGLAVTTLAASLKANSRAQIRVGTVDDNVRIVSGFFQHFDACGGTQSYNDGGCISEERGVTSYQAEYFGMDKIGTAAFVKDETTTLDNSSLVTSLKKVEARLIPRKRLQMFMGYLGDMFNFFIAKPDPKTIPETEDTLNKDQGLLHVHADASGRLNVRSASGISLMRCDRIPVPKRIRQPWDPAGDNMATGETPPPKQPFTFDSKFPYGRSLQLRDAQSWRNLTSYWHIENQKKDFYLPEESDLNAPDNDYDPIGAGTEEYKKYDKRQAGLSIEEDGSIILRDAWGSEIIMRGGNIVINAAAQIEVRSGKSTVVLAGHDAVIKARQSVDLMATEKDVRIKADGNLHMLAEGRNGGGNVLIESLATGAGGTWAGGGEAVHSKGIVFKAQKSAVVSTAETVRLNGSQKVILDTFNESNQENSGEITLSANIVKSSAREETLLTTKENDGIQITPGTTIVAGKDVLIAASSGATIVQEGKALVPMTWVKLKHDPYGLVKPSIQALWDTVQNTKWLSPFAPLDLSQITFTYRSSAEYGTIAATEIQGGTGFLVFQSFWAYMASSKSPMVPTTLAKWTEYAVNNTKPWPGSAASKSYVQLSAETNVASNTGIAKNRSALKPTGGSLAASDFDKYEVVVHE